MIERRAPCSAASATARSTAARWPLTTICPGLLSLATAQTWPPRRRLGDLARGVDVEPEQRRHRALADRHRLLHRLAAALDEARRRRRPAARPPPPAPNIRRASGRRHRRRAGPMSKPASLFEHADHREARRQQRRLGVLGQRQLAFRPLEHQPRQMLRQRVVDFLEEAARRGKGLGKAGPCRASAIPAREKQRRASYGIAPPAAPVPAAPTPNPPTCRGPK